DAILRDLDSKEAQFQEQKVLGKNTFEEFLILIEQGMEEAEALKTEIKNWETEVTPLLTNEEGKFLSADRNSAESVHLLFKSMEEISMNDVERLAKSFDSMRRSVREVIDKIDRVGPPRDSLASEMLERITSKIEETRESMDRVSTVRRSVQRLLQKAKKRGGIGSETLQSVFNDIEAERLLQIAGERERILYDADLENTRHKAASEISVVQGEIDEMIKEIRRLRNQKEDELEYERLVAKAKSQEVRQRLAPFLTPGRAGLPDRETLEEYPHWGMWPPLDKLAPVSVANLHSLGALKPTDEGCQLLWEVATHFRNDRPKWTIYFDTEEDREWVRESQALLIELAPIFQELEMLRY
ncbi:MAG: hypothetical protein KC931_22220, partial [Candidatus Omnitrophica bacterium]|nr:hypothetical protein [Candidatus Omnitrophota bacterium]